MRIIQTIIFFILTTTLFSCEPPVTFKEPQPNDTENLSAFPRRIRGTYLSLSDSSILRINENGIYRIYDVVSDSKSDSNSIDIKISGDTSINISTGAEINNVSLGFSENGENLTREVIDTVFTINYDNVLRKYKGYYFINSRYDKDSWQVMRLSISKGELTIGNISEEKDIDALKDLTENKADTVAPYKFSLTKKQFKEFNKGLGFSDNEVFVKIK
jgi:hypothetical protein